MEMIESITAGATAVVGAMASTISTLVANENVMTLIGLAIGYGIVKFVVNFLPMIKSH